MSHASVASITLGGVPQTAPQQPPPQQVPQQHFTPAPAQQPPQPGQGQRRRRRNVPTHMQQQHQKFGGGGMTFGTAFTSTKPLESSTPDQQYQTQTLFGEQPQPQQIGDVRVVGRQDPNTYQPGPREQSDDIRAAQARAKIQEMGISPEQVEKYRKRFNVLDLNKDGVVNLREFAAISRVLGYKFSKMEVLEIFGRKDIDDSGGISFDEFVLAMYERTQKAKELAPYREKFRLYDWKDRGYITSDEAYPVLKKDLGFDENKTEMLIDQFDRNKDYKLSLLEFIEFYKKVEELKVQVHNAFRDFDRNGDGLVDVTEMRCLLAPKGFTDQQIESLMFKYDKDADGMLNYTEFAAFWDVKIV